MSYIETGLGFLAPVRYSSTTLKRASEPTLAVTGRAYGFTPPIRSVVPGSPERNLLETRRQLVSARGFRPVALPFSKTKRQPESLAIRFPKGLLPRPGIRSLRSGAVSLPTPRHNDQFLRPPVPRPVSPYAVNRKTLDTVVATAPVTRASFWRRMPLARRDLWKSIVSRPKVTVTRSGMPLKAATAVVQKGSDPVKERYHENWSAGSTNLSLAQPPASTGVAPAKTGLKFSDIVKIEPVEITTPEEEAKAAALPEGDFLKYAMIGLGLFIFFGSARKEGRRYRRRSRGRRRRNPCRWVR